MQNNQKMCVFIYKDVMYNVFCLNRIGDVMMKLQKRFLFLSALVATSLVACNNAKPEPQPEPDNTHVDVFVLSGQSNMQGNSSSSETNLRNAFNDLGFDDFDDVYGDLTKVIPLGGGGTNFDAPFRFVENNRHIFTDIKGIIILTDGECNYPDESLVKHPVLWVYTTKNNQPPFGKSTTLEI
jgi:hypothetical protein